MTAYTERLLIAIAAPDARAKAAAIADLEPPDAPFDAPPLPRRPGRPPHYREETGAPARRRRTLKHDGTRNRFLLAIHHIELSAVDLALCASLRGGAMERDFHRDQLAVAREEAEHAGLLEALLVRRGLVPGCEPVHFRLWEAALAARDLGELLVVAPRFLEARGLDVSAEILPRLATIDGEAHAVIARIYRDEIGHVAIGTRWHRAWCAQHGLDPAQHFAAVVQHHFGAELPGAFALDHAGRAAAGFTADELAALQRPPQPAEHA